MVPPLALGALGVLGLALWVDPAPRSPSPPPSPPVPRYGGRLPPRTWRTTRSWSAPPGVDAFLEPWGWNAARSRMAQVMREQGEDEYAAHRDLPPGIYRVVVAHQGQWLPLGQALQVEAPGQYHLSLPGDAPRAGAPRWTWSIVVPGLATATPLVLHPPAGATPATWTLDEDPYAEPTRAYRDLDSPSPGEFYGDGGSLVVASRHGPGALAFARGASRGGRPVILLLHKEACGMCTAFLPRLEAALRAADGRISAVAIEAADLARTTPPGRYPELEVPGGFPTVRLFVDGRVVREATDPDLEAWLTQGEPAAVASIGRWASRVA